MRLATLRAQLGARAAIYRGRVNPARLPRAVARRLARLIAAVLLSPLALVLHVLGFTRLTFGTTHIGHLAAEPDCFLKARMLGELPNRRWFFLAPPDDVSNEHMLSYWTPSIRAVRTPVISRAVSAMSSYGLMRYDAGRYFLWYDSSVDVYRLNARWAGRPPLLRLTPEDEAWGEGMLRQLGIPEGAWFVCLHAREPGFSPQDEPIQGYRNSDPAALLPAVHTVVARGGWCIRMGDPSTRSLPQVAGLVDYAHSPLRSARLDVVLCAKAKFFLGNSSGLALVSSVFGRPVIRANAVPMSGLAPWPADLSVPKLYWRRQEERLLRFDEILGTPAASYRYATQYERAGIELQENSPDEILDATVEMLDRLDGRRSYGPEDDELQKRFMSLLRPGDYGYGAASRVGAGFLHKYRHLLPD